MRRLQTWRTSALPRQVSVTAGFPAEPLHCQAARNSSNSRIVFSHSFSLRVSSCIPGDSETVGILYTILVSAQTVFHNLLN
jgi:hypothetical protein